MRQRKLRWLIWVGMGKRSRPANRIDTAHTTPWKLATAYALLSIAESLARQLPVSRQSATARQEPSVAAPNDEILTLAEVAEMTRQQPSTLRWWRAVGQGGLSHLSSVGG